MKLIIIIVLALSLLSMIFAFILNEGFRRAVLNEAKNKETGRIEISGLASVSGPIIVLMTVALIGALVYLSYLETHSSNKPDILPHTNWQAIDNKGNTVFPSVVVNGDTIPIGYSRQKEPSSNLFDVDNFNIDDELRVLKDKRYWGNASFVNPLILASRIKSLDEDKLSNDNFEQVKFKRTKKGWNDSQILFDTFRIIVFGRLGEPKYKIESLNGNSVIESINLNEYSKVNRKFHSIKHDNTLYFVIIEDANPFGFDYKNKGSKDWIINEVTPYVNFAGFKLEMKK